jgi:putative copper export protein/methionine-rich copper-binding protein CopC
MPLLARALRPPIALFALIILFAAPTTAYAHGHLKSSTPANGAVVNASPLRLRLDFSETPELPFTTVRLVSALGKAIDLGPVQFAPDSHRAVLVEINAPLAPDTYTVIWQMAGDDGHPVRGEFDFTVSGTAAAGAAKPADTGRAAADAGGYMTYRGKSLDVESPGYIFIRWGEFLGLLLVIGAVAFRQLALRSFWRASARDVGVRDGVERRSATIGAVAGTFLVLVCILRFIAQWRVMHDPQDPMTSDALGGMFLQTRWGWGWIAQTAGAAIAAFAFSRARATRGAIWWSLASVAAIALAFSPSIAGHAAAAARLSRLAVVADGLHVLSAGGWLGSLAILLLAGIPSVMELPDRSRGPAVAALVTAFNPTAIMFAGILVITGVFAAWIHVGSVQALWQTKYGIALLLKLATFGIVALIGAFNWRSLTPILSGPGGPSRLRLSATLEVAFGALVLLVTAILVAMPTSMDAM